MSKSIPALVHPRMLVWARESMGLTRAAAARAVGIKEVRLSAWEQDPQPQRPTVTQLRKLADAYRRPIAAFFLPEPPAELGLVADFRRLPGSPSEPSPELIVELRRSAARREIALDLARELDEVPPQFEVEAGAAESPDAAADLVRSRIGFDAATRRGWQSEYAALRAWRRAIEDLGALVFQISGVDVEETRGFSCYYHPLPVIAVNSADAPVARVFTLAHELGHLMRRSGATCDLRDGGDEEVWCNRFAGELLVPRDELTTLVPRARAEWTDSELQRIARAFWVSSEVALRRLVAIERATPEFYEQWRARRIVRKPTTAGGPVPIPKRLLSSAGTTFVRLVLSAFHADRISASTMASYLGVKLKHLSAIEQLVVAEAS